MVAYDNGDTFPDPNSFSMALSPDAYNSVDNDLGENWLITKQYFKPYPVCRWAQAPIAAVLDLKRTYDFSSTDVASVHITSFYEAVRLGQKKVTNTEEAQYSTSFPCAIA